MSKLTFKRADAASRKVESADRIKVIIADDELDVHVVTRFVLNDYEYQGKKLEFLSAYSGAEAKQLLLEHPDASLILLDIVMEQDDAGLGVVEYIRKDLHNDVIRIILRTGQPGMADEEAVVSRYAVNDYREKNELTSRKFKMAMTMALRSYADVVAERILAAFALQESETKFRAIIEAMPLALALTDAQGNITYLNNAFVDLLGYTADEIPTLDAWWQHVCPDVQYRQQMVQRWQRSLLEQAKCNSFAPIEVNVRCKNGLLHTIMVGAASLSDRLAGSSLVTLYDITERKQMEAKLRESGERLALATRVGGIGIWDWDIAKDELVWDESMFALYGLQPEGFSNSFDAWQKSVHPDDRECARLACDVARQTGNPLDIEFRVIHADGSIRHIKAYARVYRDERGVAQRMVGVNWDITKQKQVEEQLFQSMRQLEAKELSKNRFLAAAGHDLRQPLTAANMFIYALKSAAPTPRQDEIIQRLNHSMSTFGGLLDALLNVSKLDAGRIRPEYTSINVAELIIWLEQNFAAMARDKQIGFRVYFPVAKSLFVCSDVGLVKSVLMNLVSNAIKFTLSGGILVSARLRRGEVLFQIWDTGIGIPDSCIEHVFDEFYQVDNPQRDRGSGLGLGLSIVKRSLALLGSEIGCRSANGRGTVFEFSLPLADMSVEILRMDDSAASDCAIDGRSFAHGKTFVVVEDDMLVAQATCTCLEQMGGRVQCYDNAEAALRRTDAADYYVVDYMLGGALNGIEFLNRLRRQSARPIHAVLMTGDTSGNFIRESTDLDWPVLYKPVNVSQLLASLAAQLSAAGNTGIADRVR